MRRHTALGSLTMAPTTTTATTAKTTSLWRIGACPCSRTQCGSPSSLTKANQYTQPYWIHTPTSTHRHSSSRSTSSAATGEMKKTNGRNEVQMQCAITEREGRSKSECESKYESECKNKSTRCSWEVAVKDQVKKRTPMRMRASEMDAVLRLE